MVGAVVCVLPWMLLLLEVVAVMVVVMVVTNRRGRLGPFLPPIDARTESGFAGAVVTGDPATLVAYAPVVALLLLLLLVVV